jgi:hypothetical protein
MSKKPLYAGVALLLLGAGYYLYSAFFFIPLYEQTRPVEPPYTASLAADAEWIPLFNGENLDGWTAKITGYEAGDNYADTYRVEDGAISVNYDKYTEFDNTFGNLFYDTPYSYYVLRLEYRFLGEQVTDSPMMFWAWRNSGVMVHSQGPASMALEQYFPASIEVQLLGAREDEHRSTGNVCTPATNLVWFGSEEVYTTHCTNSLSRSFAGDRWVQLEVEVWGSEMIRHFVDGDLVLEYTRPQLDPSDRDARALLQGPDAGQLLLDSGYIALQSESHPVQFRNIMLHPIQP